MAKKKGTGRHKYGPMEEHSFKDGTYQTCEKCGAVRFKGDRYSYPRRPCSG